MASRAYVAIDLGAESGRVVVGTLEGTTGEQRLDLREVHRFLHEPLTLATGLHWNIDLIWDGILHGLRAAAEYAQAQQLELISLGVDCWGVDYVLLDERNELLAPPRCYRDPRHAPGHAILRDTFGFEQLFNITGIQEMPFNTLPQLAASLRVRDPEILRASRLLLLPDHLHMKLGAPPVAELTIASTSQLLDAATGDWSEAILSKLGLSRQRFATPRPAGSRLGPISPAVAAATGLPTTVTITLPASHDTASAVVGVPAGRGEWAYISSGTWSLVGVERHAPVLDQAARTAGFSNERGPLGTFRFQKNVVGLWLIQELRRDLAQRGTLMDYRELSAAAARAQPLRTRIEASHPSLIAPGDCMAKIAVLARESGSPQPRDPGEFARCCLEALAREYARGVDDIQRLTASRRVSVLHVVGGGSQHALLNQLTADATGCRVLAGPAEATAAGNILVQVHADGRAIDLVAMRSILRTGLQLQEFVPQA